MSSNTATPGADALESQASWRAIRPLLDALDEAVYVVDRDRRILYWNASAEALTGHAPHEVTGTACHDNLLQHVDAQDRRMCEGHCPLHATLCDGKSRREQIFLQHKAGHRIPVSTRVIPLMNDRGELFAAAEIFRPVSVSSSGSRDLAEARRMAFEDALTGLPNRRAAEQELMSRLYELQTQGAPLALLMLDLDRFKRINDQYGHAAGDAALKVVADSLAAGVRAPDVVARWGGEEFLVLLSGMSEAGVRSVAERLRVLVRRSRIRLTEGDCRVTVSVGATLALASDTPMSVVARADDSMYAAKRDGGDRVTFAPVPVQPSSPCVPSESRLPTLPSLGAVREK